MAIVWPQSFLTEVAERRCVIVLGAGASSSSVDRGGEAPPDWNTFLARGISRISNPQDASAATELLEKGAALDAAQVMADALGAADFSLFVRDELEAPGSSRQSSMSRSFALILRS